jgi:hypothetical protein
MKMSCRNRPVAAQSAAQCCLLYAQLTSEVWLFVQCTRGCYVLCRVHLVWCVEYRATSG